MKPCVIRCEHLVKDYGHLRGNFDLSLSLLEGECLGISGENGAGKTTLLRQIMGFIKPDSGSIQIYQYDAYTDAAKTKQYIGYIPGEINFPDVKSGTVFLHEYGSSLGAEEENYQYADQIIQRMQLDIRAYPKRMSKGMKQKTAIVAALMLKAPILIMDEPTTGLDPLMREEFLELVLEQKKRGASIIMTSNTIEELERVCDKVALLSQGKIVDVVSMEDMRNRFFRDYKIEFIKEDDYLSFLKGRNDIQQVKPELLQVTLRVAKEEVPMLMRRLSLYQVKYLSEKKFTLSDYFTEKRRQQKGE